MRRSWQIVVLTLVVLVAHARPASAGGIWAWLEEWSGPGPFKGLTFLATTCVQDGMFKTSPIAATRKDYATSPDKSQRKMACVYYDQAFYHTDADTKKGFPELKANFWDVGPAVRLFDWLDIGAGVGRISFTPEGSSDSHAKFGFTPIRVVFRPLYLFPVNRQKWMGILCVFIKETFFSGPYTGADFGAPNNPFTSAGELKTSAGMTLDLTALIYRWKKP